MLAAWLNPLIVFAAAAGLLTLLNIACCNWIQRRWESWIAGNAKRLEARLEKMRKVLASACAHAGRLASVSDSDPPVDVSPRLLTGFLVGDAIRAA